MKSILKFLVLGAIPILAVTMVADQTLATDWTTSKGSQLIFQSNMAHTNYISVANTSADAVTVLVQYYNNEMEMAVWYLRVILGSTTILVDPFNHMIPGSDPATNIGDAIMASGKSGNGHFVIAVTTVGANLNGVAGGADQNGALTEAAIEADASPNTENTVNVLFPTFLAEDLHGTDNIDNGGHITNSIPDTTTDAEEPILSNNLMYTKFTATDTQTDDNTSKNVGGLTIDNAQPIAFNHLAGHFTEALVDTDAGGADQTASWGGTPIVRPAVTTTGNVRRNASETNYLTLNGMNTDETGAAPVGGRLFEKDAGGAEVNVHIRDVAGTPTPGHVVGGFLNTGDNYGDGTASTDAATNTDDATTGGKIRNGTRHIRGINNGALELPALHGGGAESKQIMLLLSVADDFGATGKQAGAYKLIPAMTGYDVIPMDQMGNALDMKAGADDPVFGGGATADDAPVPSAAIIVNGISVMTNADLDKCTGTAIDGPWTLSHLTDLVPAASAGGKDFAGLDAMIDPMVNISPGWVKFARTTLTCEKDYGDGDSANLSQVENPDGVPVSDKRTYTAGTLIVEEKSSSRTFVTTGRALLKFITPASTFAASWAMLAPLSRTDEDGNVSN